MKKVLIIIGLLLVIFAAFFPLLGLAETSNGSTQAYDWVQLVTIPGAIAATLMIVQYFKLPLDKVWKIPTRLLVFLIAFGILTAAKAATDGITSNDWLLIVVNTFVVGAGAMGAYEMSFGKTTKQ